MILPCLFISDSPGRGRGVFTNEKLLAGTLIEIAPVIILPEEQRVIVDQTLLHDYIFLWGETEKQCCIALGYVSIYNHDYRSNAEYEMDFDHSLIRIRTVRDMEAETEICINYNGDWNNTKPVWFHIQPGL